MNYKKLDITNLRNCIDSLRECIEAYNTITKNEKEDSPMKKTYVKPEVNQIEVAANQAVAACSLMTAYWQNWDKRLPNGYPSYEAAMNAQPDPQSSTAYKVCPVYHYEYSYKTDEYNTSTGSG